MFILSEGLPPVPAKLVGKICRGEFVDKTEMLRDNIKAERCQGSVTESSKTTTHSSGACDLESAVARKDRSDNAAVVGIINSGRSEDPLAMHLKRSLFFLTAKHNIVLRAEHLPGHLNEAADALSRGVNLSLLFQQVLGVRQSPSPVPQELWTSWSSANWIGPPPIGLDLHQLEESVQY